MSLATTPGRLAYALSLALLLALFATGTAQAQWINEFHYDNASTDEGEAIEIVLPSSADPADFDLYLYNGNGGAVYDGPINLATFTAGASETGFTVYSAAIAGIQNGPDGLALTENGVLVSGQFLSYEGAFDGVGGPADGVTSTDIGVMEPSDTPLGQSLQLIGTGSAYADFTWAGPVASSFGSINDGQTAAASGTPVVTFTAAGGSVAEGDDATLTVALDFPNDTPDGNPVTVTVTFDEDASTASASDFSGPTPVQVTFDGTADNEEQSVIVSAVPDEAIEGDETAVFDLFVAGGIAELGTPATFTLTIEDGDAPEPARVQVIHNAPDPLAEFVDISIVDVGAGGDGATFQDVPFRGATPFFDLAPGTYNVLVTDEEDLAVVIIDETVTVVSGEAYQLIASGVADPSQFEPNPSGQPIAATLIVEANAQETSTSPDAVHVNVVHGVTDAPEFDVLNAGNGAVLVDDIVYGELSGYSGFDDDQILLAVSATDGSGILGLFVADFNGANGEALTLLLSGFLTPENDQGGPGLGIVAVRPDGTSFLLTRFYDVDIAEARALPNGSLVLIEGVVTRAMGAFTRMQDATGGITIRQTNGAFFDDVADGTIAPGTEVGLIGFTSEFNQLKQINGSDLQDYTVFGTTGVPEPQLVSLEEIANNGEAYESELIQVSTLVALTGDETFQAATTYEIAEFDVQFPVTLRVPSADDTAIDGTPIPDGFFTFTGVLGQFDSADPDAGYQLLPVQEDDVEAQEVVTAPVQIIHNAPDPALAEVDVYVDGQLLLDDFAFRTATPFVGVPADVEVEVAVAPGDSDSADDAIFTATYTLASEDAAYQLIASGVGEGDFEPNPEGEDIAFTLLVNPDVLTKFTPDSNVDLNFVHGTPDAPTIDVRTGVTQDIILFNDVVYGGITGYQSIAPTAQVLEVSTADGATTVAVFDVDLTDREDEYGTILASGFLTPGNEPGDAPSFGLLVVLADGSEFFAAPRITPGTEDGTTVPTAFAVDGTYPNPFVTTTTLRYDLPADALVSVEVYDVLGRRVAEVAPEAVSAGSGRTVTLDAALPSGTYVYRLTAEMPAETRTETGRMTVVR
ncbi:MAG: DUF4397 domain-containing protein [Rhodothermales bacterium]